MNLFVFGLGYSVLHLLRSRAVLFSTVAGTVRSVEKAEQIVSPRIEPLVFGSDAVGGHLDRAEAILVSVPPGESGDPVLAAYADRLSRAPRLRQVVYLSTIGVYGDAEGGWVDEWTPAQPSSARSRQRLAAEQAWTDFAIRGGLRVDLLRIAGIYGPGRNAIANLREGTARRIVKPGQVFNRIHVEDIARAIEAVLGGAGQGGALNLCDNEPAPPQDVIAYAAQLLGMEPPPEVPFEQADLSPMGRSFYEDNKRVSNKRLRETCKVRLAFPTYREGLQNLLAAEGQAAF